MPANRRKKFVKIFREFFRLNASRVSLKLCLQSPKKCKFCTFFGKPFPVADFEKIFDWGQKWLRKRPFSEPAKNCSPRAVFGREANSLTWGLADASPPKTARLEQFWPRDPQSNQNDVAAKPGPHPNFCSRRAVSEKKPEIATCSEVRNRTSEPSESRPPTAQIKKNWKNALPFQFSPFFTFFLKKVKKKRKMIPQKAKFFKKNWKIWLFQFF